MPARKQFDYTVPPVPVMVTMYYGLRLVAKLRKVHLTAICREAFALFINSLPPEEAELVKQETAKFKSL